MSNNTCNYCGKGFEGRKNQKYCMTKCRLDADKERKREAYWAKHYVNGVECGCCNKTFTPNENGAKYKYCSEDCFKEYRRTNNRERWGETNPPKHDVNKSCEWCEKDFTVSSRVAHSARFCSSKCNDTWWSREVFGHRPREEVNAERKKQKIERQKRLERERREAYLKRLTTKKCKWCGDEFITDIHNKVACSDECSRKRRNHLSSIRSDKRLNENNIVDKDITLERLFKRDSGICYICNEPCDYDDITITDEGHYIVGETYPSIDHVHPIARGGLHKWDNVRLAHCQCNSEKSDKLIEGTKPLPRDIAYSMAREINPRSKEVAQYSQDGEFIAIYNSTAEAGRILGIPSKTIQNNARRETKNARHGFVFEYTQEN